MAVTAYGLLRNRFLIAVIVVAVGLAIHYRMTTKAYLQNCRTPLEIATEAGMVELAYSRLKKALTSYGEIKHGKGASCEKTC